VVQAFPSSQATVLLVQKHPLTVSQESSVQGLPSLQSVAPPPPHTPVAHISPVVQASPSSQATASRSVQVPGVGPSQAWQSFESPAPQVVSQHTPSTQLPVWHISSRLHVLPSLGSVATHAPASQ
jgi:hypothetical protein